MRQDVKWWMEESLCRGGGALLMAPAHSFAGLPVDRVWVGENERG
jgi:hypothetical protein